MTPEEKRGLRRQGPDQVPDEGGIPEDVSRPASEPRGCAAAGYTVYVLVGLAVLALVVVTLAFCVPHGQGLH
ncbi:MAG: hypothetical protein J2P45_06210 [Candidatus Dormibacteraeota bacterium]|nr:hypothetical protein [Candidatus Dormibacteraeota bacterium]